MNKKDQEIIEKAGQLFLKFGIKSLTMDDIAHALHVSKKTIYKCCKDKSDLVCKVMKLQCDHDRRMMEEIISKSTNPIQELVATNNYYSKILQSMHPSVHYDLDKYYQQAWQVFDEHRNVHLKNMLMDNLSRGVKMGWYRKDLNMEVITQFYLARVEILFNAQIFPTEHISFAEVHRQLLHYHIRGIASKKGLAYFEKSLKEK